MSVPCVAIVGRPNVGKSSILNWLARRRLAIVDNVPGVTRDRLSHVIEEDDRLFELIDTGGIGIEDVDDLTEEVEQQIAVGIHQADLIMFVVDAHTGPVPLDQEVARRLRAIDKPIILVVNKADSASHERQADEFYRLGYGEPLCVSTTANRYRDELLTRILAELPATEDDDAAEDPVMKLAIVGRRNVGKSTVVNTLAEQERMIVSEVPGTTRDSVDVHFTIDGKPLIAIDTPGLRRSKSRRTDIDFYGTHRAQRSIRRADVVLMFFDAAEPVSRVDKQLCHYIAENFKPCIFVVNKWDLLHKKKVATGQWADYLRDTFAMMPYVPIAFITATTGKNVKKLVNHAQMLFKQSRVRVGTGPLNRLIRAALAHHPPPMDRNLRPKVYYATQVAVQPPTIVLMCNRPQAFPPTYRRYLQGVLHEELDFAEVPIRLLLHKRPHDERRDDIGADAPAKA